MNTKQLKTVKPEEEIKQKSKDQKEKPNHRSIVNLLIKNYGGFSSEDMI
ncbi:MAG: hypothetical protein GTO02_07815 [Candidatus Dadabacteria bacterium]|nr:hypothetical protein [Candidatus Dadabacteria bacterium]